MCFLKGGLYPPGWRVHKIWGSKTAGADVSSRLRRWNFLAERWQVDPGQISSDLKHRTRLAFQTDSFENELGPPLLEVSSAVPQQRQKAIPDQGAMP